MGAATLDARVRDFLAQKRIAVAGVSRETGGHPAANLIAAKRHGWCGRLKGRD